MEINDSVFYNKNILSHEAHMCIYKLKTLLMKFLWKIITVKKKKCILYEHITKVLILNSEFAEPKWSERVSRDEYIWTWCDSTMSLSYISLSLKWACSSWTVGTKPNTYTVHNERCVCNQLWNSNGKSISRRVFFVTGQLKLKAFLLLTCDKFSLLWINLQVHLQVCIKYWTFYDHVRK